MLAVVSTGQKRFSRLTGTNDKVDKKTGAVLSCLFWRNTVSW